MVCVPCSKEIGSTVLIQDWGPVKTTTILTWFNAARGTKTVAVRYIRGDEPINSGVPNHLQPSTNHDATGNFSPTLPRSPPVGAG